MYRPKNADLKSVGHAQGSVARLVEIYSRMEVGDALFSIGEGRAIADEVRKAAAQEIRYRPGDTLAPSRDEVERHWRRIRMLNGSPHFQEPVVITRKADRWDGTGSMC